MEYFLGAFCFAIVLFIGTMIGAGAYGVGTRTVAIELRDCISMTTAEVCTEKIIEKYK